MRAMAGAGLVLQQLLTAQSSLPSVGAGVIEGGWDYIHAAYALTWVAFIGFAVSVVWRGRSQS